MTFEYAPAPESKSIVKIQPQYGHFINGDFIKGKNHFPTINPSTEEVLSQISLGGKVELDKAVTAATKAFTKWSKLTGAERGKYLYRIARILQERAREFAVLETMDNGKPIRETRDIDIPLVAAHFFYHAGWADKLDFAGLGKSPKPYGVAGQIIPWNFPLLMLAWKVAPALATGNTVVLKPAESTSLTALLFAEVCQQAELPAGVVNIVTGDGSTGAALVNHAGIAKIAFTGSTEVGRILMAQCAPTIKKLGLELGGHAPFIVFEDADIDAAVAGAIASKYRNSGQTCVCANRIYVHKKVQDAFVEKFGQAVRQLRVGNGMESGTTQGPLIDKSALQKVERHIADAISKGAKLVTGGKQPELGGTFFEPTVLANVTSDMLISYEETFGPVAPIIPFESDEEVVALANNSQYGLASYFYSRDIGRIWKVAEALDYGMVGVNSGIIANEVVPFGGVKQSGLGREGSVFGMDEYLELKYVCITL